MVLSPFLVTLMVDVAGGKGFGYLGLDVGASGRLRGGSGWRPRSSASPPPC